MSKVSVIAGPCRFKTEVVATKIDRRIVKLDINSECPNYKTLNDKIPEVNTFDEVLGKMGETKIYLAVKELTKHASCPVACAILKAVEIEAGMALAVTPEFTTEK